MLDISKANADGVALYCMPKTNKDGSFSDSWKNAMRDAACIFNAAKNRYSGWLGSKW
jgi:hypothetical protein